MCEKCRAKGIKSPTKEQMDNAFSNASDAVAHFVALFSDILRQEGEKGSGEQGGSVGGAWATLSRKIADVFGNDRTKLAGFAAASVAINFSAANEQLLKQSIAEALSEALAPKES